MMRNFYKLYRWSKLECILSDPQVCLFQTPGGGNTELKGEEAFPPHNKKRMSSQKGLFKAIVRISHLPFHRAGHWENISVIPTLCKELKWHNQVMQWFESSSFWQQWWWHRPPRVCVYGDLPFNTQLKDAFLPGQAHGSACQWRTGICFLGIQSEHFCFTCLLLLTVRLGPFPSSLNSNGTSQSHEPPYLK